MATIIMATHPSGTLSLFSSCIEKWLRSAGSTAKCPQCNLKAKRSDVRVVFAKAISVQDTTERDQALRELEQEKQLRIQAQRDEAQALLQQNLARSECDSLKDEVARLKAQLEFYTSRGAKLFSPGSLAEENPLAGKHRKYSPLNTITVAEVRQKSKLQIIIIIMVKNL